MSAPTRTAGKHHARDTRRAILTTLDGHPGTLDDLTERLKDVASRNQILSAVRHLIARQHIVGIGGRNASVYYVWADAVAALKDNDGGRRVEYTPPIRGERVA